MLDDLAVGIRQAWERGPTPDLKDAVEEVETIVASMRGACAIEAICAQVAHCGSAFYAIVRLIDVGRLRPVTPGLIEGSTMIEPVGRH